MNSKLLIGESAVYHMEMPDLNFLMGCAKWHNLAPSINSLKRKAPLLWLNKGSLTSNKACQGRCSAPDEEGQAQCAEDALS